MIRLFLDFALTSALKNQDLKPYTIEMSEIGRALIEGVELDED
jgi:antitoxin PrlF